MSLEGLRAWIGEVERKLAKRTRVFLALAVIAIGLGGAAIYLAIDARESSVSESNVQALQQKLETRIDELAAGGATAAPPQGQTEAESAPKRQPEKSRPKSETGKAGQGEAGAGTSGGGSAGTSESVPNAGTESVPNGATGGAPSSAKLQELLEQAKERSQGSK